MQRGLQVWFLEVLCLLAENANYIKRCYFVDEHLAVRSWPGILTLMLTCGIRHWHPGSRVGIFAFQAKFPVLP